MGKLVKLITHQKFKYKQLWKGHEMNLKKIKLKHDMSNKKDTTH